jgi:hypothetical protein
MRVFFCSVPFFSFGYTVDVTAPLDQLVTVPLVRDGDHPTRQNGTLSILVVVAEKGSSPVPLVFGVVSATRYLPASAYTDATMLVGASGTSSTSSDSAAVPTPSIPAAPATPATPGTATSAAHAAATTTAAGGRRASTVASSKNQPVTHWKPRLKFRIVHEVRSLAATAFPWDVHWTWQNGQLGKYLPYVYADELHLFNHEVGGVLIRVGILGETTCRILP